MTSEYDKSTGLSSRVMHHHLCSFQDVECPVHLLLDLGLGERRMGAKAYVSKALSLGERRLGTVFHETRFGLVNEEADRIGVNTLIKCSGSTVGASGALGEGD